MSRLSFDPDAALRWANFSGDFNPIHFDRTAAALAGCDGLVVHGMLALLHMKQCVDAEHGTRAGWRQFKVMFRKPLTQGLAVSLDIGQRKAAIGFSLGDGSQEYFKGSSGDAEAPMAAPAHDSRPGVTIEWARVRDKYLEFRGSFPFATQPWIFVDALVFSDFLGHEFKRLQLDPGLANAPALRKIVVQMSHRVVFDAAVIASLLSGDRAPAIAYSVARPLAFLEAGSEFGAVELTVTADERVVLQQEIGLLSRDVPA